MTVDKLQQTLGLKYLCREDVAPSKEINGCYCGDLLSWVMSGAQPDNIWLTVIGNVNSIGVAVLTDISCIVLTENAALDKDAEMRAIQNGVVVLASEKSTYDLAVEISRII